MTPYPKRTWRRAVLGVGLSSIVAAVAVLGITASAGTAARTVTPSNTSTPTVTGTPTEGQKLTGANGTWSNSPTDFNDFWTRCDKTGNSCANISGATSATYTLTTADTGNTIRFKVQATNSSGSAFASSVPTAIIAAQAATTTAAPPASGTGCPSGTGPVSITNVTKPAGLLIDAQQVDPASISRGTAQIILRYHVSNTCKQAVQGALVYVLAVPFAQFNVPAESTTGADGWAEVVLRPIAGGFPVSGKQQLVALFVRARKSGEDMLAGISARRLFSVPVRLAG
jgi:hypothetical protein